MVIERLTGCRAVRVILIGMSIVLSGCATLAPVDNNHSSILLTDVNAKAVDDPQWFAHADNEKEKIMAKYTGGVDPRIAVYLENDLYFYEDEKIENYLTSILDRLLKGWQGKKPQIRIVIESKDNVNAYVDELNIMHITTGLLRNIKNEDQIAAVLAHEISHVLLRHNSEKSLTKRTETVIEISGMLMAAGGTFIGGMNNGAEYKEKGQNGLFGCQSFGLVWADMLAPFWSRENENEADRMGLDLLIRANYNYEEFPTVIEMLHDEIAKRSKRLEQFRLLAYGIIEKKQIPVSGNTQVDNVIKETGINFGKLFTDNLSQVVADCGVGHDDREKRIDSIKKYLNDAYDGGDLPPEIESLQFDNTVKDTRSKSKLDQDLLAIEAINALSRNDTKMAAEKSKKIRTAPNQDLPSSFIAKSSVEIVGGQFSKASEQLVQLTQNSNAPAEAYIKLAKIQLTEGKHLQAENILNLGTTRIGRDYKFLPMIIRVQKSSGMIDAAEKNAIRCKEYESKQDMSWSKMLFNGGNGGYYQECVDALGYDVIAKKKTTDGPRVINDITNALKKCLPL